ncbi:MAG: SDR family NAD(P)-dependent oxidoreductase [Candidatus Binatia bacterium]
MGKPVVVITGASSGIGEALARRIGRDKRDLVLVARRADRLGVLARELSSAHGIEATPIPVDLIQPAGPPTLVAELDRRGLEVEWLVNNAGFGTAGRIDQLPVEGELDEIKLNVEAPVALTGLLLPGMVQRRRGAVVNVASVAGFGPMGFTATYAATKAFLIAFSEAIAVELEGTGVHVLCVCPGFTRTEFQEKAHVDTSNVPGFAWMSAEAVADETVRAVGRQTVLVNGTLNRLITMGMRLVPRSLIAKATARSNRGAVGQSGTST